VKIDAGVTVDGAGKPQTHFYESYLNHRRDTHGKETHLATLTRWTPDTSLCTAISRSIRFGQVVSWLVAAAREAPMSTAALAEDWARYLKKRRWAMMDISPDHLNALRAIIELKSHLRDVVEAATKAASLHDGSWYTKGRASESAFDEEGRVQWGPPLLHRHRGKHAKLQLGCHYGICQGEPCIRPVVWSSDDMVPRGQLSWPTKKFGEGWILVRDSIVALLGSQASNAIWDHMKSQLAECLAEVDRLIRESQPAKGRSGFLGLGKRGKE
jgi:hypothetical protein